MIRKLIVRLLLMLAWYNRNNAINVSGTIKGLNITCVSDMEAKKVINTVLRPEADEPLLSLLLFFSFLFLL